MKMTKYLLTTVTLFLFFVSPSLPQETLRIPAQQVPRPDLNAMLTVPDGTAGEMLEHFHNVLVTFNQTRYGSQEEQRAAYDKIVQFSLEVAGKALSKNPTDDEQKIAYGLKFRGLSLLAQKDKEKKQELLEFAGKISTMENLGPLADVAKALPLDLEMGELIESEDFLKDAETYRNKLVDFVQKNPNPASFSLLIDFLNFLDFFGPEKEVFAVIQDSGKIFLPLLEKLPENQKSRMLDAVNDAMEKAEFHESLFKTEFKLEGINLQGEKFDLKSLQGKVVLIDFWATWCGPCIAELPNLKKAYEKYKDKGFEIVGYSVDHDVTALKNFVQREKTPWISLSMVLSVDAGLEDYSETYQVTGIPTLFLFDKDGKLVSARVRGDTLEKQLENLLR